MTIEEYNNPTVEYIDSWNPTIRATTTGGYNTAIGFNDENYRGSQCDFWLKNRGTWYRNQSFAAPEYLNEALDRAMARALRKAADTFDPPTQQ